MTGISEADMERIEEFLQRNKFERSPELLCPDEEEEPTDENASSRGVDGRAVPAGRR